MYKYIGIVASIDLSVKNSLQLQPMRHSELFIAELCRKEPGSWVTWTCEKFAKNRMWKWSLVGACGTAAANSGARFASYSPVVRTADLLFGKPAGDFISSSRKRSSLRYTHTTYTIRLVGNIRNSPWVVHKTKGSGKSADQPIMRSWVRISARNKCWKVTQKFWKVLVCDRWVHLESRFRTNLVWLLRIGGSSLLRWWLSLKSRNYFALLCGQNFDICHDDDDDDDDDGTDDNVS